MYVYVHRFSNMRFVFISRSCMLFFCRFIDIWGYYFSTSTPHTLNRLLHLKHWFTIKILFYSIRISRFKKRNRSLPYSSLLLFVCVSALRMMVITFFQRCRYFINFQNVFVSKKNLHSWLVLRLNHPISPTDRPRRCLKASGDLYRVIKRVRINETVSRARVTRSKIVFDLVTGAADEKKHFCAETTAARTSAHSTHTFTCSPCKPLRFKSPRPRNVFYTDLYCSY